MSSHIPFPPKNFSFSLYVLYSKVARCCTSSNPPKHVVCIYKSSNVLSSDLLGCWRNDTPHLYHTLLLQWSILCTWLGNISLLHPFLPSVHQSDLHLTPFQPLWMRTCSPDGPSSCTGSAFSYWRFYSAALPLCWLCSSSRTWLCTASDISHACRLRRHLLKNRLRK